MPHIFHIWKLHIKWVGMKFPDYHQEFWDFHFMGVRRTYIRSQLNPKSKGNFAIKSKSSEIIKSLNPSAGESQIMTNWMPNTFYTLNKRFRGSKMLSLIQGIYSNMKERHSLMISLYIPWACTIRVFRKGICFFTIVAEIYSVSLIVASYQKLFVAGCQDTLFVWQQKCTKELGYLGIWDSPPEDS